MMKLIKSLILVLAVTFSAPSFANNHEPDGVDIMADVGLRFVGLVGTLISTALYIGISPFTAISHAVPPHQSFQKLGEVMVVQPAKYTFIRPIGEFSYAEGKY